MATVNIPQLPPSAVEPVSSAPPGVILGKSTPRDIIEMIQIYERNVQTHGFSARTLLYPNDELHDAKVKQYCDILLALIQQKQIIPGNGLLDIGCGYGSLFEQLNSRLKQETRSSIEEFRYRGIDVVPEFIEWAKSNFDDPGGLLFQEMDLATYKGQEDWCILLGVVNSIPNPRDLVWLAFSKCRKGLLVDFNNCKKVRQTNFNKFDIDVQIEYLHQLGAKQVVRFDDPDYAWTILLAED